MPQIAQMIHHTEEIGPIRLRREPRPGLEILVPLGSGPGGVESRRQVGQRQGALRGPAYVIDPVPGMTVNRGQAEASMERIASLGLGDVAPSHGPAILGDAPERIFRFLGRGTV